MKRRELLKRGAAIAVAAPYVITARSQETLIVNTQGGEYQELVEKVVIQPFEKKFGVKVIHDATGTASQDYAKIRAARGAPGFDVAGLLTPPEVMLGVKEGPAHFEPLAALCVRGGVRIHIDRSFTLDDVPAALAHVGEGRALGKVVVEVS